MDFYIDIRLHPDEEIPVAFIRNKILAKLHKALHELKEESIGVSFPEYKAKKLGYLIRLHGNQQNLCHLNEKNWLGRLLSYCSVSELLSVPKKIKGYRTISRTSQKMSNSKLQRLIKRGSISEKEVEGYEAKMFERGFDKPYLELKSTSNGHSYRRYLDFSELNKQPRKGEFDTFGLSKTATIPWF